MWARTWGMPSVVLSVDWVVFSGSEERGLHE